MTAKQLKKFRKPCLVRKYYLKNGRCFEEYLARPDWVEPGIPKRVFSKQHLGGRYSMRAWTPTRPTERSLACWRTRR